MANDWPRSGEILRHYQLMISVLDEIVLIAIREPTRFPDFQFLPKPEIRADVARRRDELDQQIVLMLTASFEAAFQVDYRDRVQRRLKDDISRGMRDLYKKAGKRRPGRNRATLEEILDIWKEITGETRSIGGLNQLVQYRHWLAHGRYWTQKSGLPSVDPLQASQRGRAVFHALRDHNVLFAEVADELKS